MLEGPIAAGRRDGCKGPLEQVGSFEARLHNCYKRLLSSSCLSVLPYGIIFVKIDICVFFEILSRKIKLHYNQTRMASNLIKTYGHL